MQNQLLDSLDLSDPVIPQFHLSDDGFYLISLITMLKQMIKPALLPDYLSSCSLYSEEQAA